MKNYAPIHKAHNVEEWFHSITYQIDVHPTYSSDLNPIMHVEVEFKKGYQEKYLNLDECLTVRLSGNWLGYCHWFGRGSQSNFSKVMDIDI